MRARGVLTASAGNHGQGVAHAARLLDVPAWIVLPESVPLAKLTAIQRAGAEAIVEGADYDEAHAIALRLAAEKNVTYVHAFDDPDVIAGQGTVALEILDEEPGLDTLIVPVGGGGLRGGCGVVTSARGVRLVGAQSESAPAFARSFAARQLTQVPPRTIADGIAVGRPAERTLALALETVAEVRTVTDEAIARALLLLLERHKLLAEPAGAAALAAVLESTSPLGRRVGVVISGGSIDPNTLGKVIQQGLASAVRYLAFRTWLDDQPGRLHALTGVLTAARINILHVGIHRLGPYATRGRVGPDVMVDTRDRAQCFSSSCAMQGSRRRNCWTAARAASRRWPDWPIWPANCYDSRVAPASAIPTVPFAEAKENLSGFISKVVHDHAPQILERSRGRESVLVLPLADVLPALSACRFDSRVNFGKQSVVATLPQFGLVASGDSFEKAIENLAGEVLEYCEDYFTDFDFYRHTDRVAHLPWLLRFALTPAADRTSLLVEEAPPPSGAAVASER